MYNATVSFSMGAFVFGMQRYQKAKHINWFRAYKNC